MQEQSEQDITETVLRSLENCEDERLKQIMSSFVTHLHDFIRDIEPTEDEWFKAIRFLIDTAAMCDDKRNEFILFSDAIGASILVDAINNRKSPGATVSSVLGPFYVPGAPDYPNHADLRGDSPGEPVVVRGKVLSASGEPVAGALLDVWEGGPDGLYHMQSPESKAEFELCGRLRSDADGSYEFCTMKPVSYPIPSDGTVGKMLIALGRHFYRPAHIHFIVSAEGHEPVVTQLFTDGDEYLASDAVFGVKDALVVKYEPVNDAEALKRYGLEAPVLGVEYEFVLDPAA